MYVTLLFALCWPLLVTLSSASGATVDYASLYNGLYTGDYEAYIATHRDESFRKIPDVLTLMMNGTLQGARVESLKTLVLPQIFYRPAVRDVLDLGCGEGELVAALWTLPVPAHFQKRSGRLEPYVRATGIDVSEERVRTARRYANVWGDRSKARCVEGSCFVQGLLSDLPFANNSFNTIFTSHVLEHIAKPDLDLVLDEVRRILRGGPDSLFVALVSTVPEHVGTRLRLGQIHEDHHFLDIQNLHLTVEPGQWWRTFVETRGFYCLLALDYWHWSFMACRPRWPQWFP